MGIWFPVSTYVTCGFEHVLAGMFYISCAKMNGLTASFTDILSYLAASTLGMIIDTIIIV